MLRLGLVFIAVMVACEHGGLAARGARAALAPRFTSEYTDLTSGKGCRQEFEEDEVSQGSDIPLVCRGPGGYQIRISYAAIGAYVSAEGAGDFTVQLAEEAAHFNEGRKAEWRLADNRPFAVILRVSKYREARGDPEEDFAQKNKTGEVLVVRGLKGQEHISFEVDARKAGANGLARQRADEAYRKN